MFRFPRDEDMKNKWIAAIPRENWSVTENTRVCSKHFEEKDFKDSSTDKCEKRRQARQTSKLRRLNLTPFAIPHIFSGLPSHYNIKTSTPRSTTASSSSRTKRENERIQQQQDDFWKQDAIDSLNILKDKINTLALPDNCCSVILPNCIVFHCFEYNGAENHSAPKLLMSVIVADDLTVSAHTAHGLKIKPSHFQHLLNNGCLKSATALGNIIVHCKALCSSDNNKEQVDVNLELAVSSLQKYVSMLIESDCCDLTKVELVKFLIEQLQLMQMAKQARRYSTYVITSTFLWQLTSCCLYKKLRELFILPSISRLRSYSSCLSVEACSLDMSYLKQRTESLKEKERLVTLMIDEVYTAKRIEYANGSFTGLTEDGEPAKTVLTFMVQSTCSKFKDVVCLVPVNKLDSNLLRCWFDKVMEALNDILFIVAVSVDNHVCNR